MCLSTRHNVNALRWHDKFGHISFDALRHMSHKIVCGLLELRHVNLLCDVCITTKHHHTSFPKKANFRPEGRLDLIHGDVCEPTRHTTRNHRRYFLLLVGDYTHYM